MQATRNLMPLSAEQLSSIWFSLHSDERFAVRDEDMHYLTSLAVNADDDVSSLLLLKKLKLADRYAGTDLPSDVVTLNRWLEFVVDDAGAQRGRIVHGSRTPGGGDIAVTSRIGLGLLGLRANQTVLWPDHQGHLRVIHVLRVDRAQDPSTKCRVVK